MKVKVRVAVVVVADGRWQADGGSDQKDADSIGTCYECMEIGTSGETIYWLTAELDVPEPKTVAAEVEKP